MAHSPDTAHTPVTAAGGDRVSGQRLARHLGLEPLPDEGGLFRRTHIDEHSSCIYFMLLAPEFSALHRLRTTEIYHYYSGAPLRMLLLTPDGEAHYPVLGPDVENGQQPQVIVLPGVWQGSSSGGEWSLVGAMSAPPFTWERFELGEQSQLRASYPQAASRITELTRTEPSR